jgi:hypothetical protein
MTSTSGVTTSQNKYFKWIRENQKIVSLIRTWRFLKSKYKNQRENILANQLGAETNGKHTHTHTHTHTFLVQSFMKLRSHP